MKRVVCFALLVVLLGSPICMAVGGERVVALAQETWEYRVVNVEFSLGMEGTLSAASATLEARLNQLGADRWECFHVAPLGAYYILFLRRPKSSGAPAAAPSSR